MALGRSTRMRLCGGRCSLRTARRPVPWGLIERASAPTRNGPGWRVAGGSPMMKPPRKTTGATAVSARAAALRISQRLGHRKLADQRPAKNATPTNTNSEARWEVSEPGLGEAHAEGHRIEHAPTGQGSPQRAGVGGPPRLPQAERDQDEQRDDRADAERPRSQGVGLPAPREQGLRPGLAEDQPQRRVDRAGDTLPSSSIVTAPATKANQVTAIPARSSAGSPGPSRNDTALRRQDPAAVGPELRGPRAWRRRALRAASDGERRPGGQEGEQRVRGHVVGDRQRGRQQRHRADQPAHGARSIGARAPTSGRRRAAGSRRSSGPATRTRTGRRSRGSWGCRRRRRRRCPAGRGRSG